MRKRKYTQLTIEQRYQIADHLSAGKNRSDIAQLIGVHKSTISRELRRNRGARCYRYEQAHRMATVRASHRAGRSVNEATHKWVRERLREEWSPQQISGRLHRMQETSDELLTSDIQPVSHEWIYLLVYADKRIGGTLHRHLRSQKKRRKRYRSGRSLRGRIPGRVCISQRPASVEKRERLGDWEGDTIIGRGHRQAIVSLVERRSRYTLLEKVTRKTASQVMEAMVRQLWPVADKVHTITLDNGLEFASHEVVALALKAQTYFAHPYSSWERGTNENTNGLVRQYCPKKSDFTQVKPQDVQAIADKLNHRPRKILGYRTPHEVFFEKKESCT